MPPHTSEHDFRLPEHVESDYSVDSVHILVLRVIGALCLLFGLIELGVGGAVYNYLSNVRTGAWWCGISTIATGIISATALNRKWVITTFVFASLSTIIAVLGAVMDGIRGSSFLSLTACSSYDASTKTNNNYGDIANYDYAKSCRDRLVASPGTCYCVSTMGNSCSAYTFSSYAKSAKQDCGNLLGQYSYSLVTSSATCAVSTIILFSLSAFTCRILFFPHKSPSAMKKKKGHPGENDFGVNEHREYEAGMVEATVIRPVEQY